MLGLMIFFFWVGGTGVSDCFTKNPNLKKKEILFFFVWGWVGGRGSEVAKLSDFFTKNPNLKKKTFFFLGGGGGGRGGV